MQCHGSPTNLIDAYATAHIPESETLLYPPAFARVAASSASLTGRPVVSCETFTCMYGFPDKCIEREDVRDLKLLADAVLAHGVNAMVYHGMPYEGGRFYASIHVQQGCVLEPDLPALNGYLTNMCAEMQRGKNYHLLAVYYPFEDVLMSAHGTSYRNLRVRDEWLGYCPVWVSAAFLRASRVEHGRWKLSDELECAPFLAVQSQYLTLETVSLFERLTQQGVTLVCASLPAFGQMRPCGGDPARIQERNQAFACKLQALQVACVEGVPASSLRPLLQARESLPYFWARSVDQDSLTVFVAHPRCRDIALPMEHGFCDRHRMCQESTIRDIPSAGYSNAPSSVRRSQARTSVGANLMAGTCGSSCAGEQTRKNHDMQVTVTLAGRARIRPLANAAARI